MAWPLYTTTSEILYALASKSLGLKGTMKLYIRERGQGKHLVFLKAELGTKVLSLKSDCFCRQKNHSLFSCEEFYKLVTRMRTGSRKWGVRIWRCCVDLCINRQCFPESIL
jgi:hypothetical protein